MTAKPLEGKVTLVTGGSRGIGIPVAFRLADQGASVAIAYDEEAAGAEETLARVAGAVALLAQPSAGWINGVCPPATGGMSYPIDWAGITADQAGEA